MGNMLFDMGRHGNNGKRKATNQNDGNNTNTYLRIYLSVLYPDSIEYHILFQGNVRLLVP